MAVNTPNGSLRSGDLDDPRAMSGSTLVTVKALDRFRQMLHPEQQAGVETDATHSATASAERQAMIVDELDARTFRVLAEMEATQQLLTELRSLDGHH